MPDKYINRNGVEMNIIDDKIASTRLEDLKNELEAEKQKNDFEREQIKLEFENIKKYYNLIKKQTEGLTNYVKETKGETLKGKLPLKMTQKN